MLVYVKEKHWCANDAKEHIFLFSQPQPDQISAADLEQPGEDKVEQCPPDNIESVVLHYSFSVPLGSTPLTFETQPSFILIFEFDRREGRPGGIRTQPTSAL